MVGRLDDWMKAVAEKEVSWSTRHLRMGRRGGVQEDYACSSARLSHPLLFAAFRNHMHWSQLVGARGDLSAHAGRCGSTQRDLRLPRIDEPVDPRSSASSRRVSDFRRAYTRKGSRSTSSTVTAHRRTLRQFIAAVADLDALVRDFVVPNPEVRRAQSSAP